MKLASLKNGHRDGSLCVVDRTLQYAVTVPHIALTLQAAMDAWHETAPQLEAVYQQLNTTRDANTFSFDAREMHSPLPRAYQWADGSAYVNHVELVRKARGATLPDNFWTDPLMYQGGSDQFLGPCDAIEAMDEAHGIDFEAEIAVVLDDVPMGVSANEAGSHIKLLMLVNDVSLRNLIPNELAKGFGFFQSKPASSFSPVVVTPDELGSHWHDSKVSLPLVSHINGTLFGKPNAGVDMTFNFAQLIAHAAATRHLCAGTIIGSGTVSNLDRSVGSSCIMEKRMLEQIANGSPTTPFLKFGDRVRIEMFDPQNNSIFGAIDQKVERYQKT